MPNENTLTIIKLTLQTMEADLHQEMPVAEDGAGESDPWDTNLHDNINLQQVHTTKFKKKEVHNVSEEK